MECPLCGKLAKTERGLILHLTGGLRNGGHGQPQAMAEQVAADAVNDGRRQPVVPLVDPLVGLSVKQRKSFTFAVLQQLVANKQLPKYEFERAIDGFLGVFLPGILSATLGGRYRLVAQEFPLRKAVGYQSTNVDYVLLHEEEPGHSVHWVFLELKTDPRSVRTEQDHIYAQALSAGVTMAPFLVQARKIMQKSRATKKYRALLGRFEGLPEDGQIEMVYLVPHVYQPAGFRVPVSVVTFEQLKDVELEDFAGEWQLFRALVLPALATD